MLPDRASNPGPLTYESGALQIALRGPATSGLAKTLFIGQEGEVFSCFKICPGFIFRRVCCLVISY